MFNRSTNVSTILTKFRAYQDLQPPAPSAPKGNNKFEILLVKIFSLKPKNKSNTFHSYRKNQILFLQENSAMFIQTINFVEISITTRSTGRFRHIQEYSHIFRHILTYSGIFRKNQTYPGIIQAYSGIFRTLCNLGIFRTLVYSKPWHIQNPGIFRTRGYFESCQTSTMECFAKILNSYNYFENISFSHEFPLKQV